MKAKKEWLVCRAQLHYGTKTKEGTTFSMWITSQEGPAVKITHFEKIGLNGLCPRNH